jgi:TRAP-type C4-dicarboxylate transport system permease small subunit
VIVLAPAGRLLLVALIAAAAWWYPPQNTLRLDLLVGLRWLLMLSLALGFLTVPKKAFALLLTGIARTFIDIRRLFALLNKLWKPLEHGVVVLAALVMTTLTFLSVLHRNFNGRVDGTGLNWLGMAVDPSPGNDAAMQQVIMLWALLVVLIILATERALRSSLALGPRLGAGVGVAISFYTLSRAFVGAVPTNIPGALTMSLGALLYLAFFGAAIAAANRKHLAVDAVRKGVPDHLQPLFAFLGLGLGAIFCGFLTWIGVLQVWSDYSLWAGDSALKVYESVPVPYWTVRIAIPIGLGVAAFRLAGHALDDLWYGVPEEDENAAITSSGVKLDQAGLDAALAEIRSADEEEAA